MKTVTEKVEKIIYKYIAEDGTTFLSKEDCSKYENDVLFKKETIEAEKLEITDLRGQETIVADRDYYMETYGDCRWYLLNNEEDYETVLKAYSRNENEEDKLYNPPRYYPSYLCVENNEPGDPYGSYTCSWFITEETMRERTEKFWGKLGFAVEFKQNI